MAKSKFTETKRPGSGPSRRTFLAGSGTVLASAAVSGPLILVPGKAKASAKVVVATWGGALQEALTKAVYEPFTKETGIPVVVGGAPDLAKLTAQVKTNTVEIDVADLASGQIASGNKEGVWAPINYKIVPRERIMAEALRDRQLAYYSYVGVLGFDKTRHPEGKHPTNWAEFWDIKKFPGRRGLRTRISETLELALMADGVDPKKVYPCDIERGFKALDRIKSHCQWIAETPKTVELIVRNEVDFTYTYNGRVYGSNKSANTTLAYSPKQNFFGMGWISPVSKAPNGENGQKLLAFHMRPDRQAHFANIIPYPPTHMDAMKLVTGDTKDWLPNPQGADVCIENIDWWGDKIEELTKRFKEWQIT